MGWPTIGRSVTRRSMWSRSRPTTPHSAQIGSSVTGEQNRCVSSSATAASVMVTPNSTVRQMVSASRLAVAFKAGPGDAKCWCRNLHLHTPQDPYILCLTASPANPSYALRIRKGPLSMGVGSRAHHARDRRWGAAAGTDRCGGSPNGSRRPIAPTPRVFQPRGTPARSPPGTARFQHPARG